MRELWRQLTMDNKTIHGVNYRDVETFINYVKSFYMGPNAIYDLKANHRMICKAVSKYINDLNRYGVIDSQWGGGDSVDRERVAAILCEDNGLSYPKAPLTLTNEGIFNNG